MNLDIFNVGDVVEIQSKTNIFNIKVKILEKDEKHVKILNIDFNTESLIQLNAFQIKDYFLTIIPPEKEIKLNHLIKTILKNANNTMLL
jgi:hypothetical protein